jgi:hypothetical protein
MSKVDCLRISLVAVIVIGCGSRDSSEPPTVGMWTASPQISLGVAAGDPSVEFGVITGATKLRAGTLAVADYTNGEVRLFTPAGQHVRSIGGKGQGPGEFPALTRLTRSAGDTLIAGGSTRVSSFTSDGEHVRDTRLSWAGVAAPPWAVETAWPLTEALFLLKLITPGVPSRKVEEVRRPRELYLVAAANGTVVDTLGEYGGLEQLKYEEGGRTHSANPVFAAYTAQAVNADFVALGDLDADSVHVYEISSGVRTWVRIPLRRRSVAPNDWQTARDALCRDAPSIERCERDFLHLPRESESRVFDSIAIDSVGVVWLKIPGVRRDTLAYWLTVDGAGKPLGRVPLPSDARVTQVGATYLLAIRRDSLGIQRVVEFSLEK